MGGWMAKHCQPQLWRCCTISVRVIRPRNRPSICSKVRRLVGWFSSASRPTQTPRSFTGQGHHWPPPGAEVKMDWMWNSQPNEQRTARHQLHPNYANSSSSVTNGLLASPQFRYVTVFVPNRTNAVTSSDVTQHCWLRFWVNKLSPKCMTSGPAICSVRSNQLSDYTALCSTLQ